MHDIHQPYKWKVKTQSSIYQIAITLTFHLNTQQSLLQLWCSRIHKPFNKMQEHYCDCACLFTLDLNIKRRWAINPIQGNNDSMPKSISQINQLTMLSYRFDCYNSQCSDQIPITKNTINIINRDNPTIELCQRYTNTHNNQ